MLWLLACGDPAPPVDPGFAAFAPAPATLSRVTDAEWRNAAEDLFGVRYDGPLPADYLLYNYSRVGGAELTIPPLDLEQYEAAAWAVAAAVAPDDAAAEAAVGCDPADLGCARGWTAAHVRRAWRRSPTPEELDEIEARAAAQLAKGPALAVQTAVASVLLAPDFLFRVELGEPGPDGERRYTGDEMAGRLASLLVASVPDEELVRAADAGELLTDAGLSAQVARLLDTPRGHAAMETFFAETMELAEIEAVTKDTTLYPEWTPALRAQAVEEAVAMFSRVALDEDADLGELLTGSSGAVGPELDALYAADPDPDARGGLLGRVAFLSIQSHNTSTSPTFRGKFVRTKLLCEDIPPPPPGVVTELAPLPDGTLRDQLEQHEDDPVCAGCHVRIDPPGFGLEHYDPIGRWRALDNGLPIDATGEIDGVSFDGAAALGRVVAANEAYPLCWATQAYRFATARVERPEDLGTIDAIGRAHGDRFRALVEQIVLSDAFRTVAAPLGAACADEGATQPCASPCGAGVETCAGGVWGGCTAPAEVAETCNGLDDDCDGAADDLERTCDGALGLGTQVCADGAWGPCGGPGPHDEECNGLDDDLNGAIDDGLAIAVTEVSAATLEAADPGCDAVLDPYRCLAAAHATCAASDCALSGFGPVRQLGDDLDVVCTSEVTLVDTSFTALAGFHGACTAENPLGGPCNAAINRLCAGKGLRTGYGPVHVDGDLVTAACTPTATVRNGSYAVLATYDAGCTDLVRSGAPCNHAIHEWCRSEGFEAGHGPLENSGDLAVVACMGEL